MDTNTRPQAPYEAVEAFTVTLLRTGSMLIDVMSDLLESMRDDAFPGEDTGAVVLECLTGTLCPIADGEGLRAVRDATRLLEEVADRTVAHLRLALELKERGEA